MTRSKNNKTFMKVEPYEFDLSTEVNELYEKPASSILISERDSVSADAEGTKGDMRYFSDGAQDFLIIHNGEQWKYVLLDSKSNLLDFSKEIKNINKRLDDMETTKDRS